MANALSTLLYWSPVLKLKIIVLDMWSYTNNKKIVNVLLLSLFPKHCVNYCAHYLLNKKKKLVFCLGPWVCFDLFEAHAETFSLFSFKIHQDINFYQALHLKYTDRSKLSWTWMKVKKWKMSDWFWSSG